VGGEGSKAGGLPHPSLSPFPPLPLSIPPKFSGKPVGGKIRSSEGGVPRLPPYKYHPALYTETAHSITSGFLDSTIRDGLTEFPVGSRAKPRQGSRGRSPLLKLTF